MNHVKAVIPCRRLRHRFPRTTNLALMEIVHYYTVPPLAHSITACSRTWHFNTLCYPNQGTIHQTDIRAVNKGRKAHANHPQPLSNSGQ
jgi:hypothetical protein